MLNYDGKHELDASIMDGKTRKCGAVAGVTTVKNPITLGMHFLHLDDTLTAWPSYMCSLLALIRPIASARLVMEKTEHIMLSRDGAEAFADHLGVRVLL